MDKYGLIRKMFVLGIVINGYFAYNACTKYIQLRVTNERILENQTNFLNRLETRKRELLQK